MGFEDDRVLQFLPWARHFARLCSAKLPPHLDHEDLQAAGILGYLRAAARYHVEGGASFRGYCAVRIRGAVLDEVRRWDWAPRSAHRNHRRITSATSTLSEKLEREPTPHELATALGVEDGDLAAIQASAQPRQVVSFDEVTENSHGEENLPLAERLADPAALLPDARVRKIEDHRTLAQCVSRLPKTQATVIVLHYLQNVPLREVARLLAVTPSRVSQLHRRGLDRLRLVWSTAIEAV
jgi:RNA polymerase sigma factor for flagellar operon FliA